MFRRSSIGTPSSRGGAAYLRTDPASGSRLPPSVRVPYGPIADVLGARRGAFPYDPRQILAPTLVVRGEWDTVTSEEDLQWFSEALSSARSVTTLTLERGTHRMHLEAGRQTLFDTVGAFLTADDTAADDAAGRSGQPTVGPQPDGTDDRDR